MFKEEIKKLNLFTDSLDFIYGMIRCSSQHHPSNAFWLNLFELLAPLSPSRLFLVSSRNPLERCVTRLKT